MNNWLRILSLLRFCVWLLPVLQTGLALGQCVGLPPVSSLGSNKFPVGLCAPVHANITYNVTFTSPVPPGTLALVYEWGDGSPAEVIALEAGSKTYNASRTHDFPEDSDCEYHVEITVKYNNKICTTTRQLQKVASWRTDAYNGGKVKLASPVTHTSEHIVCEGTDIGVMFRDESDYSCNARNEAAESADTIESPNQEYRWQQIVYNTAAATGKIPNLYVGGVAVTDAHGSDLLLNYQDPRGVSYMATPVILNDERRRSSLPITASGGYGPGFPKAGDLFELTLRYWNFCNPYDDPNIPGPPVDDVNGDHPPVESKAVIRIQAAPDAPNAASSAVCYGSAPSAFSVTGVPANTTVKWYENLLNPDRPGKLLAAGKTTTFPFTSHPAYVNNTTSGTYKVWVSYVPDIAGAVVCEGPKTFVTRSIREELAVPDPVVQVPTVLCNNTSFTLTMPPATVEPAGGPTFYSFSGSSGVSVVASTATSADFSVKISNFGKALSIDRTVTINRLYTADPACPKAKTFTIRIYRPAAGGRIVAVADVCETVPLPVMTLTENIGKVVRWEVKKDNGDYRPYTDTIPGTSLSPGLLPPGLYTFRAVVANGTCAEVYSTEEQVNVFKAPVAPVFAGDDQFICTSLSSVSLGASDPSPGTGTWSYISSVPSGLPVPAFTAGTHDPNTSVSITSANAGAYTLRWTAIHGSCISYDDVVVDFGTDPTVPDAGKNRTVCGATATLAGNKPEKGLGQWRVVSGPDECSGDNCGISVLTPASPESAVELKGPAYRYGSYTLRWSISSGGNNCFLKSDDVIITFDKPAQIMTADSVGICLDSDLTPVHLSGTITGSTVGEWVNVSGKGTMSSSAVDGSGVVKANYEPAHEDYVAGVPVRLKLRAYPEGSSSCTVAERTVTIHVDRKPAARVGSPVLIACADTVVLNAFQPLDGATGKWTTAHQAVAFDDPADANTVIRNLPAAPGSTAVQWILTSASGECVSDPVSVTISRASLPPAISLKQAECAVSGASMTTVVMLSDYENKVTTLPADARDIRWYRNTAPPSGSAVADPRIQETDVAEGQVYVARIRDTASNCTSDAKVTVSVSPLPEIKDALVTVCENTPGSRMASGIDLQEIKYRTVIAKDQHATITWHVNEADARLNVSPITSPLEIDSIRSVFGRVTQGSASQCSAVARLTIMTSPRPTGTTLYGLSSFCLGDAAQTGRWPIEIYQVTPVTGAQYYWEVVDSSGITPLVFGGGGERDFFMMLQFQHTYKGTIRVRVELNGCSGPSIEKNITVFQTAVMPVITGPGTVYEDQLKVPFKVDSDNIHSSSYAWEIHRASDHTPGGAFLVAGQSTGSIAIDFLKEDIILSVRENNTGCSSPVATKQIHVRRNTGPAVVAAFTATPTAACFPVNITLQNTSTGADNFLWKVYDTRGSMVTTSNLRDPIFRIVNPGTYAVFLVASSSVTGEEDSARVEGIAVFDVPTAALTARTPVYVPDTELKLYNYSQRANVYTWNFGDGSFSTEYEPRYTYAHSGKYMVTLVAGYDYGSRDTDGDGVNDSTMICYDSASQEVVALDGSYMEIPNAFTPSIYGPSGGIPTAGGYNDIFLPLVKNVITFRLQIFDRWGTLVFESNDKNVGWDGYREGKLLPAGVYIYKLVLDLMNGQRTNRMGDVTLIR